MMILKFWKSWISKQNRKTRSISQDDLVYLWHANHPQSRCVAGLITDPPKPKTCVPPEDSAIEVAKESFTPHAIKMEFRSETNQQKLVICVSNTQFLSCFVCMYAKFVQAYLSQKTPRRGANPPLQKGSLGCSHVRRTNLRQIRRQSTSTWIHAESKGEMSTFRGPRKNFYPASGEERRNRYRNSL